MIRRTGRTGRSGLLVLGLVATLTGCLASPNASNPTIGTPAPIATPVVTEYELGATVWFSGFVISVRSATASLDAKGGPVTVLVRIENRGADAASFDAPIRLTASDLAFDLARGTELPEIPAGSGVDLTLEFEVVGLSAIDDAILGIGRTTDHQIQVPFVPGAVPVVALEPIVANVTGSGTAGGIRATLHQRLLRWDLPDWHAELPSTTAALTLTYDVTYTGDFSGGIAFTAANVALRLPDGTIVAPRADGHSQSIELIGPRAIVRGLESRFEIPTGLTGSFAFIVRDGSAQKAIPFTIGP